MTNINVHRWDDPVADAQPTSMGARSAAAETYWLPLMGPTSLLCARRLVAWLDIEASIVVNLDVLASMLGVNTKTLADARSAPLPRSLRRLCQFGLAYRGGGQANDLWVRRVWPAPSETQLRRLPEALLASYRAEALLASYRAETAAVAL